MSTNLEIARSLARAGWHVFPLTSRGNFLKGFSWDREATTSRKLITEWWTANPSQRIGVHCGKSSLVVVDLDRKNGKDGIASLQKAGRELPETFSYASRSGNGQHHIYRAPEGEQLTIDRDLKGMAGVDIRSGIGMVVYNGPILDKKPRLAPAPEWALVHKKDGWNYDAADLDEWLDAEGTAATEKEANAASRARRKATRFPEMGISEPELLGFITPLVSGLRYGDGRREAFETARARYTADYPDPKYLIAFDRAWAKAITRVSEDEQQEKEEKSRNVTRRKTSKQRPTSSGRKRVKDLLARDFAELDFVVPDILPDGCYLVTAPPKMGKSLLALDLAVACVTGTDAFGSIKVRKRPVLLMDLESGERRLQSRMRSRLGERLAIAGVTELPDEFEYLEASDDLIGEMDAFLQEHRGKSPLVIMDTLSQVIPPKPPELNQYQHEKMWMQDIQRRCADDPGAAIYVVHHDRKDKSGDDLDAASGTYGLTGGADGTIRLVRPDRHKPEATIVVVSRDVDGGAYAVTLQGVVWTLDGRSAGKARHAAEIRELESSLSRLGVLKSKVLSILKEHGPLTPAQVIDRYDGKAADQSVRNAINGLHISGFVKRLEDGRYEWDAAVRTDA